MLPRPLPHDPQHRLDFRFCPRCAAALTSVQTSPFQCGACGWKFYPHPALGTQVVVQWQGQIVLVRRAHEPYRGAWALPGGFVIYGEETGLEVVVESLLCAALAPDDPRGLLLILGYAAGASGGKLQPDHEVALVKAFPPDRLPPLAIAFDRQALAVWYQRGHGVEGVTMPGAR